MPTPTLNLLAEVLLVESHLEEQQRKLDKQKNSLTGKLPLRRSTLHSRQVKLDSDKISMRAAKEYLEATAANEK